MSIYSAKYTRLCAENKKREIGVADLRRLCAIRNPAEAEVLPIHFFLQSAA